MGRVFPDLVWSADEFHEQLLKAADECFQEASAEIPGFHDCWATAQCLPATKTMVRQACLLGHGGPGRTKGAFWRVAERYLAAEAASSAKASSYSLSDRAGYERYQDFVLYGDGSWYDGVKVPLMVAEVESQSRELLGELSGLLTVRSPLKYLFIGESTDTLDRLTQFVDRTDCCAADWAQTAYFVVEIPNLPRPPSQWNGWRADVLDDRASLDFNPMAALVAR